MKVELLLVTAVASLIYGCAAQSADEVARVNSASGTLDGVVVETNSGATTSYGYLVFVVRHGARVDGEKAAATLYGAERNDTAYGVNLRWQSANTLVVEYLSASEIELRPDLPIIEGVKINVRLNGGVVDAKAPSGGMLYNLEGRKRII